MGAGVQLLGFLAVGEWPFLQICRIMLITEYVLFTNLLPVYEGEPSEDAL